MSLEQRPAVGPMVPAPDVAALLHALLDLYERRDPERGLRRAIRVRLAELDLPGYFSQEDPAPRLTTNEQLAKLAEQSFVSLAWQHGEHGHLLETVALRPERAPELFAWLGRDPVAAQRAALRDLLLGERFRFSEADWRRRTVDETVAQLRTGRSPAPFLLADPAFNRDLLAALVALDEVREETPYRVFSVHVYNDSKVFEGLKNAVAVLARRHGWPNLAPEEALRELGLVANPTQILLHGPWRLSDDAGRHVVLDDFAPAVGIPALMAGRLIDVRVDEERVSRVVCVENLASFYELIRYRGAGLAAVCLAGNPAPPLRHLLRCLATTLPDGIPLLVWPDLDYGGLNILAQLRRAVTPRCEPWRLDAATLEEHIRWARPLTDGDRIRLARLLGHPELSDLRDLIQYLLARGLKLEQEAIRLT
jgi:hypothetical protein